MVLKIASIFILLSFFLLGCHSQTSQKTAPPLIQTTKSKNLKGSKSKYSGLYYHYMLAEYEALKGDYTKSIEQFEKALQYQPSSYRIKLKLLKLYISSGVFDKASDLLSQLSKKDRAKTEIKYLQATLYVTQKEYDEAIKFLKQLIKHHPKYENAYILLAGLYEATKQEKLQLETYYALLKNVPSSYLGEKQLGDFFLFKKDLDKALLYLNRALKKNPKDLNLHVSLGLAYEQLNQFETALGFYETALNYNRNNALLLEKVINLYLKSGQKKAALKALQRLALLLPENKEVILKIALIYFELEDYDQSEKFLSKIVVGREKENEQLLYYYGVVLRHNKKYKKSLSYLKKISNKSDYYIGALSHQTRIYRWLNRLDIAEQLLQDKEKYFKDKPLYTELMAGIYAEQSKFTKAIELLKEYSTKFPKNVRLAFLLGIYYDKWNFRQKCITQMKKTIEINEKYAPALNYLGYLYAEMGKNLKQSYDLIKRALDIEPENGYYLDSMGWYYYQINDNKLALKYLLKALDKFPQESVILSHLGDLYLKMGHSLDALNYYRKAISYERDFKSLKTIIHKYESLRTKID